MWLNSKGVEDPSDFKYIREGTENYKARIKLLSST
jgi:hypothetical protein